MADYFGDDGYDEDDYDELDYDDDPRDDYREPDEPDWGLEEWYRYQSMSWFARFCYDARHWIWRRTWGCRNKVSARWLLLTGRAATQSDEPPF